MRFDTLEQWLAWQERLHPSAIDLGLDRCLEVARRLELLRPSWPVITVAGTNGKGSCVMLLDAILRSAGYRTGTYTSPHLSHYRERIRIAGEEVQSDALVSAFARVDEARDEVSLTFFEFGTLAALDLFAGASIDVAILEVGLGGRLDAVNIIDADYTLIASVGIDHVEWLGDTRESVGREKAGVFRSRQAAIYAEREPPASVLEHATKLGTRLWRLGVDYDHAAVGSTWCWWTATGSRLDALPAPSLAGSRQQQNAAAVLALCELMRDRLPVPEDALRAGISTTVLPGRIEVLAGAVPCIVDVAHNPQAAAVLAEYLSATRGDGRTIACLGMLADKDVAGCVSALDAQVDAWFTAGLDGPRGQTGVALAIRVGAVASGAVTPHDDVLTAYRASLDSARSGDRVVVLGSFLTVAAVRALESCGS